MCCQRDECFSSLFLLHCTILKNAKFIFFTAVSLWLSFASFGHSQIIKNTSELFQLADEDWFSWLFSWLFVASYRCKCIEWIFLLTGSLGKVTPSFVFLFSFMPLALIVWRSLNWQEGSCEDHFKWYDGNAVRSASSDEYQSANYKPESLESRFVSVGILLERWDYAPAKASPEKQKECVLNQGSQDGRKVMFCFLLKWRDFAFLFKLRGICFDLEKNWMLLFDRFLTNRRA